VVLVLVVGADLVREDALGDGEEGDVRERWRMQRRLLRLPDLDLELHWGSLHRRWHRGNGSHSVDGELLFHRQRRGSVGGILLVVALLYDAGKLLELSAPVVDHDMSVDGELLLLRQRRGRDEGGLPVDAHHWEGDRLKQPAPVVGDHLAIDLPGGTDAEVLDPLFPRSSGLEDAPIPSSFDLGELAEDSLKANLREGSMADRRL
jgi:hypothetical protein